MAPRPRRGEIWNLAGLAHRRVVIYSGNMLNDIADEDVITMEMAGNSTALSIGVPGSGFIRYTWLEHLSKEDLGEKVGELDDDVMSKVNTALFMVISTN